MLRNGLDCFSRPVMLTEIVPAEKIPSSSVTGPDGLFLKMDHDDELASAAATGNVDLVEHLLQHGASVNTENRFGRTPIQVSMMGSPAVVQLLLQYGANPNVWDSTGTTPLHDAARDGFLDTVQILVQFNADINVRDNWNRRPVDLAEENGHQAVVAFLK